MGSIRLLKFRASSGFSLLELLVAIAIIGILISLVAFSYGTAQQKARDNRRISDMKAIQQAYEQYYEQNGASYPSNVSTLVGTYLPGGVPQDPKPAPYPTYAHTYPNPGTSYCSCATLEGIQGGNSTTVACSLGAPNPTPKPFFCVQSVQ